MSEQINYVGDTSGDEILDVRFYEGTLNGKTVDYINIKVPGDKTVEVNVVADETYQKRFARKWQAYKHMKDIDEGTPVAEWDDVPEGLRRELAYQGFRFVEQVAGAPDSAFARIMGGVQWRNKAQAFLNRGKKSADDVISQQQKQIEQLQEQMTALLAATTEKRGRKSKESTQTETETVESQE